MICYIKKHKKSKELYIYSLANQYHSAEIVNRNDIVSFFDESYYPGNAEKLLCKKILSLYCSVSLPHIVLFTNLPGIYTGQDVDTLLCFLSVAVQVYMPLSADVVGSILSRPNFFSLVLHTIISKCLHLVSFLPFLYHLRAASGPSTMHDNIMALSTLLIVPESFCKDIVTLY